MKKIAVVTGASKGIGRACALRLAKDGMTVVVNYSRSDAEATEVVEQIKFEGYTFNENESEIDANKYLFKREKKKKKKDRFETKLIADSRCGLLTVYFRITMLTKDPTTGETTYQVYPRHKSMLIPLQDEKGYFYIKGKTYYLIYQLLEASTYTSANSITLKSLKMALGF